VAVDEFRFQTQGVPIVIDRFADFALLLENVAQVTVGLGARRINFDDLQAVFFGAECEFQIFQDKFVKKIRNLCITLTCHTASV